MGRTSEARDHLLASAAELMHARGYTAVGVSEICREAGVQKGSFYHFFPSKQALALAVLDALEVAVHQRLDESLRAAGQPLDRLRSFCQQPYRKRSMSCDGSGQFLGCPAGNLALEMSAQDPVLRDRLAEIFELQIAALAEVIAEAVDEGELPNAVDPADAARAVLAHLEGMILLAKTRNDPEILAKAADQALRLVSPAAA
ncbi:MAG: TetR/AcrR family transcriptional regulator [Acidobacteriota bacterium]